MTRQGRLLIVVSALATAALGCLLWALQVGGVSAGSDENQRSQTQ